MTTKTTKISILFVLATAMSLAIPTMASAESVDRACIEKITVDDAEKTNMIDKEEIRQIVSNNSEFEEMVFKKQLTDRGIAFEGKMDMKNCISNIKSAIQTYVFKEGDQTKTVSVKVNLDTKQVSDVRIETDREILATDLGTVAGNWVGYGGRDAVDLNHVNRALAYWNVPQAQDPSTLNCGTGDDTCIVTVWAGVTDTSDGSDVLSQGGSHSICEGNNCGTAEDYEAFIQHWDDGSLQSSFTCSSVTMNHGDSMYSTAQHITSGTDRYYVYVSNLDELDSCSLTRNDTEKPVWAQIHAERPVNGNTGNDFNLAKFTDFDIQGYFYDNGAFKGLDDMDTSPYDYHDFFIESTSSPYADVDSPDSNDKITINYIKSS